MSNKFFIINLLTTQRKNINYRDSSIILLTSEIFASRIKPQKIAIKVYRSISLHSLPYK